MRYDYLCTKCLNEEEVNKPLAEIDRPEACSECGAVMERQIAAVGNMFKCTGAADRRAHLDR